MFPTKAPNVSEMLTEIHSETASQLLSSILYQTSPPGSTGLPILDAQLLGSASNRASQASSLNRGDVLEIQGPAASGKTRLVYYLVMQCILPRDVSFTPASSQSEVEIGGWEKAAVVMDTDGRWNIQRFVSILTRRLEKSLPEAYAELSMKPSVQELVAESLRRLHIFRPKSSASLAATIFQLSSYHSKCMAAEEILLLAIDSISSFYWIDRYNSERRRGHAPSDRKDTSSPLSRILIALQEFRLNHGPVIVLTNWGLFPASKTHVAVNTDDPDTTSSPFYRQHLHSFPAPFEHPPHLPPNAHLMPPITHHITLALPNVELIPPETTNLQDALAMRLAGAHAPHKGEIKGILRAVETGIVSNFTIDSI